MIMLCLMSFGPGLVTADSPMRVARRTERMYFGYTDAFNVLDYTYEYDEEGLLRVVRLVSEGGTHDLPEFDNETAIEYEARVPSVVTVTRTMDSVVLVRSENGASERDRELQPFFESNLHSPADNSIVYSAVLAADPMTLELVRAWVFFGYGFEPQDLRLSTMRTRDGELVATVERVEDGVIVTYLADGDLLGTASVVVAENGEIDSIELISADGSYVGLIEYEYEVGPSNYSVALWPVE